LDFNYVEILDAVKIELKSTPEQTRMGAGAFLEQSRSNYGAKYIRSRLAFNPVGAFLFLGGLIIIYKEREISVK